MGKKRFIAEVDSETLTKAQEVLERDQITLDETLEQMLSYIVSHGSAPCFQCGEPNTETLRAIAEAASGDLINVGSIADLFAELNEED